VLVAAGPPRQPVNARTVAAWSGACLVIVLATSNPAYKAAVLAAAFIVLAATAGLGKMRRLLLGVAFVTVFDVLLNFASAHLGSTVLFALPDGWPAVGGAYTLEGLAFGFSGALTIAAALLAAAAFSLVLEPHEIMDALPRVLAASGTAIAASLNLVPAISRSFTDISEAQWMRGWRPRGPRSWAEVLVPVVLTSAESSIQLAESMEARGFGSGPRTAYTRPRMTGGDWLVVASSALAVAIFVAARSAGWAADWFAYPALRPPDVDARAVVACLLLLTPVLVWRRLD
jgi:energy-coupling factor transport system permease protein